MNDIAKKIGEVVAEIMAARQAEVAALLETVRSDIDSLQHALGTSPGTARNANAKRAPAANGRRRRRATQASEKASAQQALGTSPSTAPNANAKLAPAANGRRQRRKTQAAEKAETSQTASSKTPAKRTRPEKTAGERAEISQRMTAYWQRKRGEKAGSRG